MGTHHEEVRIRSYDEEFDKKGVENIEKSCEVVGPSEHAFLFTDTMGDPLCRIRNTPNYKMLVAVVEDELVGVIQGTIKFVTLHMKNDQDISKVGYILGLRVSPLHRRKGIALNLIKSLENWFKTNHVDYSYMATEQTNQPSRNLFIHKLNYTKFRTPAILVNPIHHHFIPISPSIQISKLKVEQAEFLYRKFMSNTDFFPQDINGVLRHKLSLGTWVAYDISSRKEGEMMKRNSWAMLSVWNSNEIFKLKFGKSSKACLMYGKGSRFIDRILPCLKVNPLPDFRDPFGFYFVYGVYKDGPCSGRLVKELCNYVHNMAKKGSKDCKVIVTEVGGNDTLKFDIPHWKLISCPEDLWCIKSLRDSDDEDLQKNQKAAARLSGHEPTTRTLFVDPREV